jgi:hypothetical protein
VRKHIVISGPGRSGTTFLVEILTYLGIETGFELKDIKSLKDNISHAGLENDIRNVNCPYVVKSPDFCDYANEVFKRDDILIEHIFIPIRNLRGAAESRRTVFREYMNSLPLYKKIIRAYLIPPHVRGGLWYTYSKKPGKQEDILLRQVYRLLLATADSTIPVTLMYYPRIVMDSHYLYQKLKPILNTSYDYFFNCFKKAVQPELINKY